MRECIRNVGLFVWMCVCVAACNTIKHCHSNILTYYSTSTHSFATYTCMYGRGMLHLPKGQVGGKVLWLSVYPEPFSP